MDYTGLAIGKGMLCRRETRRDLSRPLPCPLPALKLEMEAEVWRLGPQSFGNGTDARHLLVGPWPVWPLSAVELETFHHCDVLLLTWSL